MRRQQSRRASRLRRRRVPARVDVRQEFHNVVNMTAPQIRAWLATPESKRVGFTYKGERESVGRKSARKIIRMLTGGEFDEAHARKVIGYVHRHLAQRPSGDVSETPWRYSLMNWGHDPLHG
jgi:hypothetical protein